MKRLIAISFLFIFLATNTAFGELLRLPILIHHYLEHVEWDNMAISEFISEHYGSTINHPDDKHNDHQKLPFKAENCHTTQAITLVPSPMITIRLIIPGTTELKKTIHQQQYYSNAYLNSIWQPPRFN